MTISAIRRFHGPLLPACSVALLATLALASSQAQVVPVPARPVVGSSNPATAEPPVTRPSTTPCTVNLYNNQEFADYSAKPISYTPPAACTGPWAKVVLTLDFTVTAGRQYDRTASLYLGNANIFYGTTAEPRSALSPSWHVERDVTDLSAIFKTAQSGQAIVYNIFNSTYNGDIFGTATLLFYPANLQNLPPIVPDIVVPVSGANSPFELDTTASQVTATVTAPRNVSKVYLDVIAQSQQGDEFWYLCVPNDVTTPLESCGNTAFRESEISIDGTPAGVAPVYPWIFTGGIDPYLWEPITGVQTLNFKPYRVDLSPFAGVLSDGNPHTVSLSVYNANGYFDATANLLLYTDHLLSQTGGGLLEDTLSAEPVPTVNENLSTDPSGNTTGTVTVQSVRNFKVKGYVNTSLGRVETTVEQKVHFNSTQTFNVGANDIQDAEQTSTVESTSTQRLGPLATVTKKSVSFPLVLNYAYTVNADGSSAQTVSSNQRYLVNEFTSLDGFLLGASSVTEQVKSKDTLSFSATGALSVGPTKSSAEYIGYDTSGQCYRRSLTSENRVLTSVTDGAICPAVTQDGTP